MERGLKVAGGDRLGKTIIFARNHRHAEFILSRFNAHYPHLAGGFAQVIDNYINYADNLIDKGSRTVIRRTPSGRHDVIACRVIKLRPWPGRK